MPDKKLTDNEIKKALECCGDEMGCGKDCPFYNGEDGACKGAKGRFEKATLDLINRLQADNERLTIRLRKAEHQLDDSMKMYNIIKAEAYKEFAERLCEDRVANDPVVISAKCLLKELVGDA